MTTLPVYENDPPTLKVALCQVRTEQWKVDANLERTLAALDQAAAQGAELAITPECVLDGYGSRDDRQSQRDFEARVAGVAEPSDGPRLARIRATAKKHGMDVVVGFAEKAADGRLHNSAVYIARDGEIVFTYRKVHCRRFEAKLGEGAFVAGERFHVADRAWRDRRFRIGAMIGFDREIPETGRCLRALGAELIACPLATDTSPIGVFRDRADNELITRCRAAENEQFVVVVNHAGRFNGGSFAVGPFGEVWCQLGAGPEVRTIALPVGAVARKFHNDAWGRMGWGYARPEVYAQHVGAAAKTRGR